MYDKQGEYVKCWLPELAKIPAEKVHFTSLLSEEEQKKYNLTLDTDYPSAIIDVSKWLKF